jgi:hypothetical protein
MRELAFHYAQKIQPFRSFEIFQQVHDALQLSDDTCQPENRPSDERTTPRDGVDGESSATDAHVMRLQSICKTRHCIL